MIPIQFPQANAVLGADQPQYEPLPVCRVDDEEGQVISCWKLTLKERIKLLFNGRLWLRQLTFNLPLQPQLPQIETPFLPEGTSNPVKAHVRALAHSLFVWGCLHSWSSAADVYAPYTYHKAYAVSREKDVPLVILLGAGWCPHCQTVKNKVIPELTRRGLFEKAAFAYVDSDRNAKDYDQLRNGDGIPQLIVYTKRGEMWQRSELNDVENTNMTERFLREAMQP